MDVREYGTHCSDKETYDEVVERRDGGLGDGIWCIGYLVGE